MFAWGAGTQGQLGNGAAEDSLVPTAVACLPPEAGILQVACGGNHTLCLTAPDTLFLWGASHLQQQHQQDEESSGGSSARQQQAGQQRDSSSEGCLCLTPQLLQLPSGVTAVRRLAAGWAHTLVLSDGGVVFAAGDNSFGQLGLGPGVPGSTRLALVPLPQQQQQAPGSPAAAEAVDIAAGMRHSLVLLESPGGSSSSGGSSGAHNALLGFGSNKWQQLLPAPGSGAGSMASSGVSPGGAAEPAAPASQAQPAGSKRSGSVVWLPAACCGLPGSLTSLAAGGDRSAAITEAGCLLLWGRPLTGVVPRAAAAAAGALEQPQQQGSSLCRWPQPRRRASWLASGSAQAPLRWCNMGLGWRHVVALDSAGQLWSAGDGSLGQLGCDREQQQREQEQTGAADVLPCLVALPGAACCVAAGAEHGAAVLQADGSVVAWGWGEHGQVGGGSTADARLPQHVLPAGVGDDGAGGAPARGWRAAGVACGSGFTVAWGE